MRGPPQRQPCRAGGLSLAALASLGASACSAAVTSPTAPDATTNAPALTASFTSALPDGFTVPPAPAFPAYVEPTVHLTSLDVELVRRLTVARRCEARLMTEQPCEVAWSAVAQHGDATANPYGAFAKERVDAWARFAAAERARREALSTLESAYRADVLAASKVDEDHGAAHAAALRATYAPFEAELRRFDLADLPRSNPKAPPLPESKAPWDDPLGTPDVLKQRVIVTAEAGAYAESFDLDTSDGDLADLGAVLPSFDLSGFFTGASVAVNIANEGDLAIGVEGHARVHVGTELPAASFESGASSSVQIAPADDNTTTSVAFGLGPRVAGNVAERIAMSVGLHLGYLQVLAPGTVPLCGADGYAWDPALRGFQGDIVLGFEFYPLSVLSLGLAGRVGFAHVESEWCSAVLSDGSATPIDVSADSFGAGASGAARVHF